MNVDIFIKADIHLAENEAWLICSPKDFKFFDEWVDRANSQKDEIDKLKAEIERLKDELSSRGMYD